MFDDFMMQIQIDEFEWRFAEWCEDMEEFYANIDMEVEPEYDYV